MAGRIRGKGISGGHRGTPGAAVRGNENLPGGVAMQMARKAEDSSGDSRGLGGARFSTLGDIPFLYSKHVVSILIPIISILST